MQDSGKVFVAIFALVFIWVAVLCHGWAQEHGVDTGPVILAVMSGIAVIGTFSIAWFWTKVSLPVAASAYAAGLFPCSFPVLDNMADKVTMAEFGFRFIERPWYGGALFQYGVEALLVGLVAWLFLKD